jgi:probable F420-dependent oxidoreductase
MAAGPSVTDDIGARLGPLGVWGHLATLPADALRPFVARVAELGYGSLWVGEATMRDPFAQLAAVADASAPMMLGTSIVNIFGRDAMAARMGAMTLHELTGGRFVLGLGVSHVHLVEKLRGHRGHPYERPLSRMRAYVSSYATLPYRGPTLAGPDGAPNEPPVLLAALRRRMLELAAAAADGALPFLVTAERVAWMRRVLDEAALPTRPRPVLAVSMACVLDEDPTSAREAARAWIAPYCRSVNYQASLAEQGFEPSEWEPPYADRLLDAIVAWGSPATLRERVARMQAAGADHVSIIPVAPDGQTEHLPVLVALAPASDPA